MEISEYALVCRHGAIQQWSKILHMYFDLSIVHFCHGYVITVGTSVSSFRGRVSLSG